MAVCGIDLDKRPFYLDEEQENWVRETLGAMSLREKAGQLFCVMAKPGKDDEIKAVVKEYGVGGVLFRPVHTKAELKAIFKELDGLSKYPLIKSANLEEGGSGGFTDGIRFSTQMGAAACGNKEAVRRLAYACAAEGTEVGINWTYSPVCDLDWNFRNPITNVRSYGSDVEKVLEYTEEYVKVVQSAGMAACAKHFPGDGVDFRDQHLHPTCNTLPAKEWYDSYGRIYKNLIDHDLLSVMVGHILQPAVEREMNPDLKDCELLPGSLSRNLVTGVLREKFGFNGLITTDATVMNGFTMAMEREHAIPQAILAGCDMLCFSTDVGEDIGYIIKSVEEGWLPRKRLDEAIVRILAFKAKTVCRPAKGLPESPLEKWAGECAGQAVTLVKDVKKILPVKRENYDRIMLISLGEDATPDGSLKEMMAKSLESRGIPVEFYDAADDKTAGPGSLNKRVLTVYLCNMEAKSNNTAVHLYWPVHAMGSPKFPKEADYIFISFSNPYHLADVPRVPAYINAYTASRFTVKAVAEKLFGESDFCGESPVDPFCGLFDTKL